MNDLHVKIQIKKGFTFASELAGTIVSPPAHFQKKRLFVTFEYKELARGPLPPSNNYGLKNWTVKIYRIWIIHIETSTMSVTALNITIV